MSFFKMRDYIEAIQTKNRHKQADAVLGMLYQLVSQNQLYEAHCLSKKLEFPDQGEVTTGQHAKYHYFIGRIALVGMDYVVAQESFERALRSSSINPSANKGFRLVLSKLLVLTHLLQGRVPSQSVMSPPHAVAMSVDVGKDLMMPFKALVKAMTAGDVAGYHAVANKYHRVWALDGLTPLVARLGPVIQRLAVRTIVRVYSRVAVPRLMGMLGLESLPDTIGLISSCIATGGLDARLDTEDGVVVLTSLEADDVYQARDPQNEYHRRAMRLLAVRHDMVHAMRYRTTTATEGIDVDALEEEVRDMKAVRKEMAGVAKKDDVP